MIPAYRSCYENKNSYNTDEKVDGFDNSFFENLWDNQIKTYSESGYFDLINYIYDDLFQEYKDIGKVVKETFGVHVLEIDGKKYCFVLFNTAWSCVDDSDKRHIIIGDFQLRKIKEKYDDLTDENEITLTFAMGHHPLNYLYGKEQDNVFNKLIFREGIPSEVYMCGHTHNRDIINWSSNNHTMYTLMTGIGWPDTTPDNQSYHYYSVYNFDLDINSLEIYVRSTKGSIFHDDLSIYGESDSTGPIVKAIRPQKQLPFITINTANNAPQKKCSRLLMLWIKPLCFFAPSVE